MLSDSHRRARTGDGRTVEVVGRKRLEGGRLMIDVRAGPHGLLVAYPVARLHPLDEEARAILLAPMERSGS